MGDYKSVNSNNGQKEIEKMTGNLSSRIKKRISQLLATPTDDLDYNLLVPSSLLREARKYLRNAAKTVENRDEIIRQELGANGIETTVLQVLLKLHALGYAPGESPDLVLRSVKFTIDHLLRNYPCHVVWTPVKLGVHPPDDTVATIENQIRLTSFDFPKPWNDLEYAVQNTLASWNGYRWIVSPAGRVLAGLSTAAATVYLLSLETYLCASDSSSPFNQNPWHMSLEFLSSFLDHESVTVDIGEGKYTLSELDDNMTYLNRLGEFELITTHDRTLERRGPLTQGGLPVLHFADDFFETELTAFGRRVLETVVRERDSAVALVADHMVTSELTGTRPLLFTEMEGANDLEKISKEHAAITGNQDVVIQKILDDVRNRCTSILTLRSVPPTLERIIKNILIAEGAFQKDKEAMMTLGGCVKVIKGMQAKGTCPFHSDTLSYIQSIERNAILHGNITPTDVILESFLNIMLNTLLKVYQDYAEHQHVQ
ncbi:MAG: hypothetical protein GQ565_10455 [Candidatus Aegiribacteria sp.]|nr:hypothetical protein [Candidatus Aegiribacteria sp.]